MQRSGQHVFRFFVDSSGGPGARVQLAAPDVEHLRVLRLEAGAKVEVVDANRVSWVATVDDAAPGIVVLGDIGVAVVEPVIELFACVRVGGRYDDLVDAAVQAGATRVVPIVTCARDAERIGARHARVTRIAATAAKQAKRGSVPVVEQPVSVDELLVGPPGIVVAPDAPDLLDAVVGSLEAGSTVRLLVGAADGFPDGLVAQLVDAGWTRGRLGPTILRAELAAAVAVAIAAMHATTP
jgi:RsmE family RNA methyltransferase